MTEISQISFDSLTKLLENDKEYMIKTLSLNLNAELHFPSGLNPQDVSVNNVLFFDFPNQIENIKQKLAQGEIEFSKYQDFTSVISECKLNLKSISQVFEYLNRERLENRTWIVKMLLRLAE